MNEHIQRIVNALPEDDRALALSNAAQSDDIAKTAQVYLNLSYLPERVLSVGQHLWPPTEFAAQMLSAPTIGALINWLALAPVGVLCGPFVFTSENYFDVYLTDRAGYFYRSSQGDRIQRVAVNLWLSSLFSLLSWLGGNVRSLQVELPWYRDGDLPLYLQHWHVRVGASERFAVLRVPNSIWRQALPRASQSMAKPVPDLLFSVRQQILAKADLATAASAVNMSVPTLKRQLKLRRTSFRKQQQLINAMLCDHAERYLGVGKAELMQRFNMHDRSTFNRAYQRWFASVFG